MDILYTLVVVYGVYCIIFSGIEIGPIKIEKCENGETIQNPKYVGVCVIATTSGIW
jgi:hypothetical protein